MQMSDRILARRYARALYECADARGETEQVSAEIKNISGGLSGNLSVFKHPRVSAEEKRKLLRRAVGTSVSPLTLRFLDLLIEKKRFGLLPHAAGTLDRLYDEGRGVVHAAVRAASPLTKEEAAALREKLGAFVGKKVILDFTSDPEILAGVVVRLGDWVFDASLKGRLRSLHGLLMA
ncbi:ATP synthase F1 subunit delta [Elusimicrobiota bacterium]